MSRKVETAIVVDASRHGSLSMFVDRIKSIEASGVSTTPTYGTS